MMDPIHICLSSNSRYLPGLLVAMVSIVRSSSDKKRLVFHVFSDGLSYEEKQKIIDVVMELGADKPLFHEPDINPIKEKFNAYKSAHTAFLRLFYCDLIDEDWVVYTDVDTLWMRDISELWELRDDKVSVLWCRDLPSIQRGVKAYSKWNPDFEEDRYSCSGVMLMNLKRMRESKFIDKCIDFVTKWGTPFFVDQDILNYVCRNDEKALPPHWDCLRPNKEAVNGVVYHFTGIGSMFNDKFSGWRPLYYPWFRFYYDIILKDTQKPVCSLFKQALFWLLGFFYPNRKLFTSIFSLTLADNIQRQIFFAWLWRHAKWKWNKQSFPR